MSQNFRTAESVSPGHPDKICDQISDAILDAYLEQDSNSRVAIEVVGGHGKIFITGEVTSSGDVDIVKIAQSIIGDIEVEARISKQSPEIAQGVDIGGAGDQGIMIGYATNETQEFLPIEVVLARRLNQFLYQKWPFDGKTQVTVSECDGGFEIETIVASWQNVAKEELTEAVQEWANNCVSQYLDTRYFCKYQSHNPKLIINPAGDWNIGGFEADAGLTGRKIVVDNYGPRIPIGGGCFSGKDATKVDRSGAYAARRIAVDYLKKHQAKEVFVRLAYAIGRRDPVEATVVVDGNIKQIEGYDLTPGGIIKLLDLNNQNYQSTARYGHFGEGFSWDA